MEIAQAAITGPEWIFLIALLAVFLTGDRTLDPVIRRLVGRPDKNRSEKDTSHLQLYYRPTCPYCLRVITRMRRLGLHIRLRNIRTEETARQALVNEGGKQMVPCLRIRGENADRWLYESADIVAYLKKQHE